MTWPVITGSGLGDHRGPFFSNLAEPDLVLWGLLDASQEMGKFVGAAGADGQ